MRVVCPGCESSFATESCPTCGWSDAPTSGFYLAMRVEGDRRHYRRSRRTWTELSAVRIAATEALERRAKRVRIHDATTHEIVEVFERTLSWAKRRTRLLTRLDDLASGATNATLERTIELLERLE